MSEAMKLTSRRLGQTDTRVRCAGSSIDGGVTVIAAVAGLATANVLS